MSEKEEYQKFIDIKDALISSLMDFKTECEKNGRDLDEELADVLSAAEIDLE
jgi:hypothetical protein